MWWRRRPRRVPRTRDRAADAEQWRERIRTRIDALETERLELLADECVPGRKHRLDAVDGALDDLRTDLARTPG